MDDNTFEIERTRIRCEYEHRTKLMAETLDRVERVYREFIERDALREREFWKRLEKVQADKLDVIRVRGENQRDMLSTLVPVVLPLLTEYLKQKAEPVDTNYDAPEPPGPTAPVEPPQAGEAPSSTEPPFEEA